VPTNTAYPRCESCYKVVDWRSCPTCRGKGTIIINN
jgi:DnaJ-class molecular chaperone